MKFLQCFYCFLFLAITTSSVRINTVTYKSPERYWAWEKKGFDSPADEATHVEAIEDKQETKKDEKSADFWAGRELTYDESASDDAHPLGRGWVKNSSGTNIELSMSPEERKREFWRNYRTKTFNQKSADRKRKKTLRAEDVASDCEYFTSHACDCDCQKEARVDRSSSSTAARGSYGDVDESDEPTEKELRDAGIAGPPGDGLADMTPLEPPKGAPSDGSAGPFVDPGLVGKISDEVLSIGRATPEAAGRISRKAFGEMMGGLQTAITGAVNGLSRAGVGGNFDEDIPASLGTIATPADELGNDMVNSMIPSAPGGIPDVPALTAPVESLLDDKSTFHPAR
eukprot:g4961.t1